MGRIVRIPDFEREVTIFGVFFPQSPTIMKLTKLKQPI
jgi:hypothetical protein